MFSAGSVSTNATMTGELVELNCVSRFYLWNRLSSTTGYILSCSFSDLSAKNKIGEK